MIEMLKILGIVIVVVLGLFGAWMLISYIDVVINNLDAPNELAKHNWNLITYMIK